MYVCACVWVRTVAHLRRGLQRALAVVRGRQAQPRRQRLHALHEQPQSHALIATLCNKKNPNYSDIHIK